MKRHMPDRRQILQATLGMLSTGLASTIGRTQEPTPRGVPSSQSPVGEPRATDGDSRSQPDWEEQLTLTVGPGKADIVGTDDKALQAAIDSVARLGGGTVRIQPGLYTLRNTLHIPSRLRLLGSGAETVITKIASEPVALAADSDWYDQEITLKNAESFRIGDGVVLVVKNTNTGEIDVIKRTIVARSGRRLKLNEGLRKNVWLSASPTCAAQFPLLTSERTGDVTIEQLTLDGDREHNVPLNGNYSGCVFLQDCSRVTLRQIEARNYNGDGISFQVCHDVLVENCHSHDHAGLCLHPGSGSQRPVIRGCRLERSEIGLFWCWGVRFGIAEGNRISDNSNCGISIGHNDTDNVMRDNEITGSGRVGILFRDDKGGRDFWPHRTTIDRNRVINTGDGIAIDIQGRPQDVRIVGNELRQTLAPPKNTGIRIGAEVGRIELANNIIDGFAIPIDDRRQPQ